MRAFPRPRFGNVFLFAALLMPLAACTSGSRGASQPLVPQDEDSFVVQDVRVFDGRWTIQSTTVVVRDGRIFSIGGRAPRGLRVIDGRGRTLLPGLIDAHGHVPNEAALRDALRFGVTTVFDMLSAVDATRPLKEQRDRLVRTDRADLFTAGSPLTSARGLGTQFGIPFNTIGGPEEATERVRTRIAEGSDYIKVMYEPGAPLFTTVSAGTLKAIVDASHASGVLAIVHISALVGARDAVAAGVDGLVHVFSDTVIAPAFAQTIAARRVFVTPTLSIFGAFQNTGFGASLAADPHLSPFLTSAQRTELVKAGPDSAHPMAPYLKRFDVARALENVRRLRAAGVRILAGTDAPNLGSHGASLHGELELLVSAGFSPAEALTAATLHPAEAFRLRDRGRIVLGARADLVLVDGDPTVDVRRTRAIVRIFKNGFEVSRALPTTPNGRTP